MNIVRNQFAWVKSGLFWRTFFLITFLIATSMAAWVASFRIVERTPRANQIAAQVISIVTITRAALTHSAPDLRRELLFDLASNEGVRVYPRETSDIVRPPPNTALMPVIQERAKQQLGMDTVFAGRVNDIPGFWVSFKIEDDEYWLMLERDRVERTSGIQWLSWVTVTLLLSLIGAVFISRLINQPLARLTNATQSMAKGLPPEPLPEKGPAEIKQANRSFNQMVRDLNQIESDRAIILAGISHDLRTPIARMLLELEMAHLPDDARQGMHSDLAQMDAIIGQFLDYAKPTDISSFELIDISFLVAEIAREAARLPDVKISTDITEGIAVRGNEIDLRRSITNLIENARRYGKKQHAESAEIDVRCFAEHNQVIIEIADHGIGVPDGDMEYLLRPFTRMDTARGQANGSGLGLAIVHRIVKRHNGQLHMSNRAGGGLAIRIVLDSARGGQASSPDSIH